MESEWNPKSCSALTRSGSARHGWARSDEEWSEFRPESFNRILLHVTHRRTPRSLLPAYFFGWFFPGCGHFFGFHKGRPTSRCLGELHTGSCWCPSTPSKVEEKEFSKYAPVSRTPQVACAFFGKFKSSRARRIWLSPIFPAPGRRNPLV